LFLELIDVVCPLVEEEEELQVVDFPPVDGVHRLPDPLVEQVGMAESIQNLV